MHSDDRRFWWDGTQWVPAWSPDGSSWFDGARWQPAGPPRYPAAAALRDEPRRRGMRWWVVALIVVGALVPVAFIGVSIAGLVAYATADEPNWIDREDVTDAAAAGCSDVAQTISASPDDVAAGNAAIDRLTADVLAVGKDAIDDDMPTADWLDDWADVKAARTATLDGAPFVVPRTDDDYAVTDRMIDASPEVCARAVRLARDL